MTQEYHNDFKDTAGMPWHFKENPDSVRAMINEIKKFDTIRNQNWLEVFPLLKKYYARYL